MEFANEWPLWITEDVTWPVMWGLLITAVLSFAWYISRHLAFLLGSFATLGLVVFALVVEQNVITEQEYLTDAVYSMAAAVRNNDVDGIVQFVRPENELLRKVIDSNANQYDFQGCRIIGFNLTEIGGKDQTPRIANIGFAVYATGCLRGRPETTQPVNMAVKLRFQKSNGTWYLEDYGFRPSNSPAAIRMRMENRGQ